MNFKKILIAILTIPILLQSCNKVNIDNDAKVNDYLRGHLFTCDLNQYQRYITTPFMGYLLFNDSKVQIVVTNDNKVVEVQEAPYSLKEAEEKSRQIIIEGVNGDWILDAKTGKIKNKILSEEYLHIYEPQKRYKENK